MKHKADKAIIMAAGKGTRLEPITKEIAKPLVEINGKIIIEGLVESLINQDISKIYIVTGYLRHQFEYLPSKYSNASIVLLYNPLFEESNNISSLYIAREYLGNCIIADGDLIINNPKILDPYFDFSGYCSMWTEETDGEWLQQVDENDFVISCSRTGGIRGWQLFSISFWSNEDGLRLKDYIENVFEREENKYLFWDDIPIFLYKNDFRLKIRRIGNEDLQEIDTLEDFGAAQNNKRGDSYEK